MGLGTSQFCSEHPGMVLEIIHGRTQFKERPVTAARFLIGSGDGCDLRLNAPGIPALHSLLLWESGEALLEAVAPSPELFVNGQPVREALVRDGDLIRIGLFELRARFTAPPPVTTAALPELDAQDIAALSAAELVDALEGETGFVADVQARQQLGVQALFEAVAARKKLVPQTAARGLQGPHFRIDKAHQPGEDRASEIDNLAGILDELTRQLDDQHQHASHRETTYAAATEELLESHAAVTEQVQNLARQIAELQNRLPARVRAIA